ncbi:hypothetical protein SAMN05216200_110107 [Oceanicella actignis]|uniref:Uncharacterized protein n=1 Tax=Oceanicella actignis TaxID=1189325 RepID=A0A1M7TVP5_9RHOB|nr:hypothetical protein SAMN04488119_101527 [Oceanicella actignis]SHN74792.1 hypothetical protein SAMN05216200_110107 [Oceanicella actignis]
MRPRAPRAGACRARRWRSRRAGLASGGCERHPGARRRRGWDAAALGPASRGAAPGARRRKRLRVRDERAPWAPALGPRGAGPRGLQAPMPPLPRAGRMWRHRAPCDLVPSRAGGCRMPRSAVCRPRPHARGGVGRSGGRENEAVNPTQNDLAPSRAGASAPGDGKRRSGRRGRAPAGPADAALAARRPGPGPWRALRFRLHAPSASRPARRIVRANRPPDMVLAGRTCDDRAMPRRSDAAPRALIPRREGISCRKRPPPGVRRRACS